MAAEIINLRRVKKQHKRAEASEQAAENRAKYGRPKSERKQDELETARASRELEGHKLDRKRDDDK